MSATLRGLDYIVQIKEQRLSGTGWWESIAAFNSDSVAKDYAENNREASLRMYGDNASHYRAIKRRSKLGAYWSSETAQ